MKNISEWTTIRFPFVGKKESGGFIFMCKTIANQAIHILLGIQNFLGVSKKIKIMCGDTLYMGLGI